MEEKFCLFELLNLSQKSTVFSISVKLHLMFPLSDHKTGSGELQVSLHVVQTVLQFSDRVLDVGNLTPSDQKL